MSFKLTWKAQIICLLISIVTVFLIYPAATAILDDFFSRGLVLYPTGSAIINFNIYVLLLMIPVTIFHEIIHGAAYILFGGKAKFGFKGIFAYTQEISGKPIQRIKFLIVLLSPLIIISLISLLLPSWIGGMIFLLNLLGASGDIYTSLFLCRFHYDNYIIDRTYGFDVIK